jgi:hypothetical protein
MLEENNSGGDDRTSEQPPAPSRSARNRRCTVLDVALN